MKAVNKFQVIMVILAAVSALTACGGGGGGGGGGGSAPAVTVPTTPVAPVVVAANLVNSVPVATYTGEAANAFALLNAERNSCGFGLLAQNAQLDAAATAHSNYAFVALQDAHTETAGVAGFTGVTVTDRAIAKGYAGTQNTVSEVMSFGSGNDGMRLLLSGPYHMNTLTRGYRDVGIGYQSPVNPVVDRFTVDIGYLPAAGEQSLASTDVLTYPCAGSTGVNWRLRGETPNPVPGRDLSSNPIGTPIKVAVRTGNVLGITSSSMIKVSTGAVIAMRTPITVANDPHPGLFRGNEGYVAPDAALEPGTQYQVTITGTNNGNAFSRTFTFTTGTGVN